MSEVIGDTGHLHDNRVPFCAVHTVKGLSDSGHFTLSTCSGFKHLLTARASIRIVSSSLNCMVIGPAAADKAISAHIAVVPAGLKSYPTSAAQIMTIGGSAYVQHSLYVVTSPVPLSFAPEVAHQLKPKPVIGEEPEVVFHFTITGGSVNTEAFIKISGYLEVDGVGFATSW